MDDADDQHDAVELDLDALRVPEGLTDFSLAQRATSARLGLPDKAAGRAAYKANRRRVADLQELLWAEDRRSVLLVLQGMDAAGKDGTIRRVLKGVNPQGVHVAGFKQPSTNELDRDYLWRVHQQVPRRGTIGVFNRSHYEDVAVVRVLGLVDDGMAERRFRHIREFERMLADEGTAIIKVFLHVGRDEQAERLQARLDDPDKHWKFSLGDLDTRARWDDHQRVYAEAIAATSTDHAPWYVVPADRKWASSVAVSALLRRTLEAMDPQEPEQTDDLSGVVIT